MNTNTDAYMELQHGQMATGVQYMRGTAPAGRLPMEVQTIEAVLERIEVARIEETIKVKPSFWRRLWTLLNMDIRDVWRLVKGRYGSR